MLPRSSTDEFVNRLLPSFFRVFRVFRGCHPSAFAFVLGDFAPLREVFQVKIREFEPDSRQIREITVVEDFLWE